MKTIWFTRSRESAAVIAIEIGQGAVVETRPPSATYPDQGPLYVVKRPTWIPPAGQVLLTDLS